MLFKREVRRRMRRELLLQPQLELQVHAEGSGGLLLSLVSLDKNQNHIFVVPTWRLNEDA
jgi:hypothetical protein